MQYSVPWTSLSIVLGMATSGTPAFDQDLRVGQRVVAADRDQDVDAERREVVEDERRQVVEAVADGVAARARPRPATAAAPPSRILRGFVREVCRIVPPVRSIVRVLIRSSGRR